MREAESPFIEGLVVEEIRRLVAESIRSGDTLSTAKCIAKVRAVYPTCGISKRALADEVMMAAAAAGIPVEIGAAKAREKKRPRAMPSEAC